MESVLNYQNWCDLTFLHWPYAVREVQQLVPAPLQVESFDGCAWVGLVPFFLRGLRPVTGPGLLWNSNFPETNCRTYVRGPDGKSGVWFFSLDAARVAAVVGARTAYGLPYWWSQMRVQRVGRRITYTTRRRPPQPAAFVDAEVEEGDRIETRELELFLTARLRLYSVLYRRLVSVEIEHAPWPLRSARVLHLRESIVEAAGLPAPRSEPIIHFSPGVHVKVDRPRSVRY